MENQMKIKLNPSKTKRTWNSQLLATLAALSFFTPGTNVFASEGGQVRSANMTHLNLDPKLPEPFARTQAGLVSIDSTSKDATLVFIMSESEGIEVTFPIIQEMTDACNNTVTVAAPPASSTPYAKDFEIKIIDYTGNTCAEIKPEAPTVATLKSYEVSHKSTTLSTFHAEALKAQH